MTATTAVTVTPRDVTESQAVQLEQLGQHQDDRAAENVAFEEVPKWNHPRGILYRTLATFWTFLLMGMNDAAYGVSCRSWNAQCSGNPALTIRLSL